MSNMLTHQQIHHLDNSSVIADSSVSNLEFPDEESFNSWLSAQNEIIERNLARVINALKSDQKIPEGASRESVKW